MTLNLVLQRSNGSELCGSGVPKKIETDAELDEIENGAVRTIPATSTEIPRKSVPRIG